MRRRHRTPSRLPPRMPPRTVRPPCGTRQYASAFNQLLSLDTSSVTTMSGMFYVRSALAPPLIPSQTLACTLHAPSPPHALPPPAPHAASHRTPSSRHSAGRVGVQPAAEPRHLQRHRHERHVLCALRACPNPRPPVRPSPAARCTRCRRPTPCRLPPRMPPAPHAASHRTPSLRHSAVRVGVQPAAEPRHLQRHNHERHVWRALRSCPTPPFRVRPSPARCMRRRHPTRPPASRPACRLAPYALLAALGRARRRSTSR
jgi:hypothetical protein